MESIDHYLRSYRSETEMAQIIFSILVGKHYYFLAKKEDFRGENKIRMIQKNVIEN
jgi:hypothetical protein